MCRVTMYIVVAVIVSCSLALREARGDTACLSTQSDPGALLIKQLQATVDDAECQLLKDITYTDYDVGDHETFDFIVVGAGSAGSVVANRLSENPNWKVLLLEAGGDPTITSEIPALFGLTQNTNLDWQYRTEPEPTNCLGSVNRRCAWPRGKVLGGSSAINAMLYVRGHPRDYDGWEAMGNPGWQYKYMLPYFKKSEGLRSKAILSNGSSFKYHGNEGYLKVESYQNNEFFKKSFSKAFRELGYQSFDDVNAEAHEGFFTLQGTLENSRRCSTARAFLHDFQVRSNLKISTHSLVTRVLIDNNKIAYGVEFSKAGKTFKVKATKEVILSGGSINSPQLLMLSGIGPREHLEELGINVVKNSKVGYNLQDHIFTLGFIMGLDIAVPPSDLVENMFQFLVNSKGDFAGVNLFNLVGFIRTGKALHPNIQIYFTSSPANSTATLKRGLTTFGINEDIQRSIVDINSKRFTLLLMPSLLNPRSRGRIRLNSTNPLDHPLINPGYFSNEGDVEELLEAIEFAKKFAKTKPMRDLGASIEHIDIPGCKSFPIQSTAYWRCVIKHMSVTVYHPVGTCRMGPRESSDSVVDPLLRVNGIKGLRVIDASVMPTITSGNTNAPTIAIAEKASDLIKQFWKKKYNS